MSLQQRWIDLLYRVATGNRKIRLLLAPLGAAVFLVFVTLFVVTPLLLEAWARLPKLFPRPYSIVLSIPLMVLGSLLVLWCNILFVKAKGTPIPLSPPQQLVQSGPYRYSRNPMLTGVFLLLFGLGIFMNSILLTFVFTPLCIVLNTLELKYIEEPELERRLGGPYVQYKKRVPMFLPTMWREGKR